MSTVTITADSHVSETALPARRIAERDLPYATRNLGSINSAFAPPSSCQSLTLGYSGHISQGRTDVVVFYQGFACDSSSSPGLDPSCFPSGFTDAYSNLYEQHKSDDYIYPVFSPASDCPPEYVSACGFARPTLSTSATNDQTSTEGLNGFEAIMNRVLEPSQAAVGCCPSGYGCGTGSGAYYCSSEPSSGTVITADLNMQCGSKSFISEYTADDDSTSMAANAPCLVLIHDLPQTESAITTSPTSSTTVAQENISPSSGLSTGGKAAIGVCIPLFAIFASLAVYTFFRRRSHRNSIESADTHNATADSEAPAQDAFEMDAPDIRTSAILESPRGRVSLLSERSPAPSRGASRSRAPELYGSMLSPRLHENVVELPASRNEENRDPQTSA